MDLFGKPKRPAILPIKSDRRKQLSDFEILSGARFTRIEILNLAFCHRSFTNENAGTRENNERLEFLGDSVLGLVISQYLFDTLTDRPEGELAKIKSYVVSENMLSTVAKRLGIDTLLLVGKGEENSGGRQKKALLADALEAVFGAYFTDAGFEAVRRWILKLLVPEIDLVLADKHTKDYKTLLQEFAQKTFKAYPRYVLLEKTGPDHDRTFTVEVQMNGTSRGTGCGKNKKEAEQAAASVAWATLIEQGPQG